MSCNRSQQESPSRWRVLCRIYCNVICFEYCNVICFSFRWRGQWCPKLWLASPIFTGFTTQFTCFASTKVQTLTPEEHLHSAIHRIHRNIKPSNILVNSKGEAKITDLGQTFFMCLCIWHTYVHLHIYTYMYIYICIYITYTPTWVTHRLYVMCLHILHLYYIFYMAFNICFLYNIDIVFMCLHILNVI